jgi:hypothetical protein
VIKLQLSGYGARKYLTLSASIVGIVVLSSTKTHIMRFLLRQGGYSDTDKIFPHTHTHTKKKNRKGGEEKRKASIMLYSSLFYSPAAWKALLPGEKRSEFFMT